MIEPLKKFKIAGVLWYQGETNVANGKTYDRLLAALVKSWRADWAYDFPFYYAQIAPWQYGSPHEGVVVRDAQRRALALIANSGMVVTSDIGDIENIHPANKQEVGARFANLALKYTYKKIDTEVLGPLFQSFKIDKNEIEISFDHADNGLASKGGAPTHFEIAGADQQYVPATATIKGNKIIVKSKAIKAPVYVRFAWNNTAVPNLFSKEGLPASSFTTEY
jgi:sialate O-acetylesterase